MVATYQLTLAASPAKRLSDVYGGTASIPDESKNIPYRQLIITSIGASATLGGIAAVTAGTGYVLSTTGQLTLGPFTTGPVKLSDLWAFGAGATISVLGVPY